MKPLRALTLWPEWAWAIHHLDKRVENRGWPIPLGEWFALHAGKSIGGRPGAAFVEDGLLAVQDMAHRAGWSLGGPLASTVFTKAGRKVHMRGTETACAACDPPCSPMRGWAILGVFRVTAHLRSSADPWHVPGEIGNRFDYRPLREPVPCKGAQGLWTVPEDVAARVWEVVNMPAMKVSP